MMRMVTRVRMGGSGVERDWGWLVAGVGLDDVDVEDDVVVVGSTVAVAMAITRQPLDAIDLI